jgi:hypothetical protein
MAIINTNGSFGSTSTVTNTTLNSVADAATFDDPVDETTLELIKTGEDAGKLRVKAGGVDTNQIAGSAVTKDKIEGVANMKVLGNTSGSATAPQEVEVIDDDTMATALATNLATAESIKAYIDKLKPNTVQAVKTDTFTQLDPQNSWYDIPDLSVSITPKFSNSKILVQAMVSSTTTNNDYGVLFKLVRDGTDIAIGDTDGSRTRCSFTGGYSGQYSSPSNGIDYLDSPSLVAETPVTYKVQCSCETTVDIYINLSYTDSNFNEVPRPISTLTVTEIYQ